MSCRVRGQEYRDIDPRSMFLTTRVCPPGDVSIHDTPHQSLRPHRSRSSPNRKACPARRERVTMEAVSPPERRPAEDPADASLVRRIRAGDREAVDDLYTRFRRPAFALARRILADDVLAEDVLQDVFLTVWRDPSAFDGSRGSVAAWLLAMVHHKAVDAVRREESHRRRRTRAEDDLVLAAPTQTTDVEDAAWQRIVAD